MKKSGSKGGASMKAGRYSEQVGMEGLGKKGSFDWTV